MENKNETYNWWRNTKKDKIVIADEILDWKNPIRGIYGIFIKENEDTYCAYVGRANNIYLRFFSSSGGASGHLVKIMKSDNDCGNIKLEEALKNENAIIEIKVLEEVKCQYDNYNKDMQRLAFAECYHISKYQELDQCLEQLPDGSNMNKDIWDDEYKKHIINKSETCSL